MTQFGFIITRHVNSPKTNRYWNQCVKLIRAFYPHKQVVIIDDNSNQQFVKADFPYKNVTVVQSEYPGRGELLPYVYYLKYKWFPSAVIIHDSVFIHRRINFDQFKVPAIPLWHHTYDKENVDNIRRIASALTNNGPLIRKIVGPSINVLGLDKQYSFNLCFGCQAYIKLSFLEGIQAKYRITNLVNVVHNRTDRCALERVIGLLFCEEYPLLKVINSVFGNIHSKARAFKYDYSNYKYDLKRRKVMYPFVKVWTGR